MPLNNAAAPVGGRGWQVGEGRFLSRGHNTSPALSPQGPFVYRVRKSGRGDGWPVVGKLTFFTGSTEPILAIVWRNQRGTAIAISEPRVVLLDAQARGVRLCYLREDNSMRMWCLPIADFLRGRLGPDGEHYVLLSQLTPVTWREWQYAERELRMEPAAQPEPPEPPAWQLGLWPGGRR